MERGGMEYNISEFAEWILESVKEIIIQLYCASFFPDEETIDYMNLPYYDEGGAEVAKHCIWQELPEVGLCVWPLSDSTIERRLRTENEHELEDILNNA